MEYVKRMINVVFSDIDGTLLSSDTKLIPKSALDALRKIKMAGKKLFLATGRHPIEISQIPELEDIDIDGIVAINGQYCLYNNKVIYTNPLTKADVNSLAQYLKTNQIPYLFVEEDKIYITLVDENVRKVHEIVNLKIPDIIDANISLNDISSKDIFQISLYFEDEIPINVLKQLENSTFVKWHENCIDIIPLNGGKWRGVSEVLNYLGISLENAVAIGDNDNDVELLKNIGLSIAMGNGTIEAKKAAKQETNTVENGGFSQAINNLIKCGWYY